MVVIDESQSVCTVITSMNVTVANHEQLFELLQEAIDELISKQQGFISANLHMSDNTKLITNYSQWRSLDDYEEMTKNEQVHERMKKVLKLVEKSETHTFHIIKQFTCQTVPAS